MAISASSVGGDIIGIEADRRAVIRDAALHIIFTGIRVAAAEVCVDVFGIQTDGLAVVGDCAVVVFLSVIGIGLAAVEVGCRNVRIEPDRLVGVRDGTIGLLMDKIGSGARDINLRTDLGVEPKRLGQIGDGVVCASIIFIEKSHGPIDVETGVRRIKTINSVVSMTARRSFFRA